MLRILQNTNPRPVIGVTFGPQEQTLVAGGNDGIDVWDLRTHTKQKHIPTSKAKESWAFIQNARRPWLYLSDVRNGGRMINLTTGTEHRFDAGEYSSHHMVSLATSDRGDRVALSRGGSYSNQVECWDVSRTGVHSLRWRFPAKQWRMFHGLAFSPDGEILAAVEDTGWQTRGRANACPIIFWNAGSGKVVKRFGSTQLAISVQMRFTSDGKYLVVWYPHSFSIETWDVRKGRRATEMTCPGPGYVAGLAIHPSANLVATVNGQYLRCWDATNLEARRVDKLPIGKLHAIAFSSDGRLGAAGGQKGQVAIFSAKDR